MYQCRVERDSISPRNYRLTSFVITFPRIVLAEAITHRAVYDSWGEQISYCERTTTRDISKNSASSRAIPFKTMLENTLKDPYVPFWTQNQKGMQGLTIQEQGEIKLANDEWQEALNDAIKHAQNLANLNIHKQDVNRLLEPFTWVTQIVTSSRWSNFFALRCDNAAHPAIRHIARMMYLHYRQSEPTKLDYGQWHLPFVPPDKQMKFEWKPIDGYAVKDTIPDLIKHSAARCAWVSYNNHDKDGSDEVMLATYKKLIESSPSHFSPIEHQATPERADFNWSGVNFSRLKSNLTGWVQARKLLPGEEIVEYAPTDEEVASWGIEI